MKRILHVVKIDTPLMEVQCGEETRRSSQIKHAKTNANFVDAIISMDVVCVFVTTLIVILSL